MHRVFESIAFEYVYPGNKAGNRKCVFPFWYKGITYVSCTTKDHRGKAWCSFDQEYKGKWGACNSNKSKQVVQDNDGC